MSRLVGLFNKMLGMKQCKGLVVRTSSRTNLGIFHRSSRTRKRGISGVDFVKDKPWRIPFQIWYIQTRDQWYGLGLGQTLAYLISNLAATKVAL